MDYRPVNSHSLPKSRWLDLCAPVFGQGGGFVDTNPYHQRTYDSSRPGAAGIVKSKLEKIGRTRRKSNSKRFTATLPIMLN